MHSMDNTKEIKLKDNHQPVVGDLIELIIFFFYGIHAQP